MEEDKIKSKRNYHIYTPEDVQFIKSNYLTMTYEQIGNVLGVSKGSITDKIIRLGLVGKSQINSMNKKGYRIIGSRARAVCKYLSMLARVRSTREKEKTYRGIKVLVSKEDFVRWYMPRDFVGASVDRIDNKGDYTLENMQVISMRDNIIKARHQNVRAHDGINVCYKCGEEKPLEMFVRNKNFYTGHLNICKKCHAEQQRLYDLKKKQKLNN